MMTLIQTDRITWGNNDSHTNNSKHAVTTDNKVRNTYKSAKYCEIEKIAVYFHLLWICRTRNLLLNAIAWLE